MAEVIRRLLEGAAERESGRPAEGSVSIGEARPDYQISPAPVLSEVVLHLPADLYATLAVGGQPCSENRRRSWRRSGWLNAWPLRLRRS